MNPDIVEFEDPRHQLCPVTLQPLSARLEMLVLLALLTEDNPTTWCLLSRWLLRTARR